jgi:ectoine hydroxylase-related dioxygenase (phytanoyl-CoA dioxygenase family)
MPARAALLGAREFDQFDRDGGLVLRNVFTRAELAAVTDAIDPVEQSRADALRARGGSVRISSADEITFTTHLVTVSPVLRAFAAHPAIQAICHDLIGPDVRLYWDQAVYKKPEPEREFPWHQDNGYTFIEPQQYLTLWIPLVDVDEDNGCPWIAPGRHREGTRAHWPTSVGLRCFEAVADAVPMPARAGDVVAFSSLTPHRTGPNRRPGHVRKAYILQYAPDGAVAWPFDGSPERQDHPQRQFMIMSGGRISG